jgi:hypothetical protein
MAAREPDHERAVNEMKAHLAARTRSKSLSRSRHNSIDPICDRRTQVFEARAADGRLLARLTTLLRDAARALPQPEGYSPDCEVILRNEGDSSGVTLRTALRAGAELSPMGKVA